MIKNYQNKKAKGGYSQEIASQYVGVDLPFVYVTEKPEPIHFFDQETRKYTDDIVGYRIYVTQHYGDYVQNPIMVRINTQISKNIKFGQSVRLKGLEGCNIRNKDGFSRVYFKANKIEVLNDARE
ncbi:hypothetical protein [Ligilactobacillus aviarius]|uniref:hypothetical protein n=1 Tax=Ligilactobacillus aviarius TaxID=1606 RepID=UPI0024B8F106|nr:hypothetical protein [Ligilactobacillus aviarius]